MKRFIVFFLTLLIPSMVLTSSLTNNSPENISSLTFYDVGDSSLSTTSINAQQSTTIPSTATYAIFSIDSQIGVLTIPVSDSASSNVFSNYFLYNSSSESVTVSLYATINGSLTLLNSSAYSLPPLQSVELLTGATVVTVNDGSSYVINQEEIITSSSYEIYDSNGYWHLYELSALLMNSEDESLSELVFYNSSSDVITQVASINANGSIVIPSTATYTTFNIDSLPGTFTIPVSDTASSYVVSSYYLLNSSSETVTVSLYTTINGVSDTLVNSSTISLESTEAVELPTGTNGVTVIDITGTIVLTTEAITTSSSYEITDSPWALDQTSAVLTNNSDGDISNLTFYDSGDTVRSKRSVIATLGANKSAVIPSTATYATFDYPNIGNSRMNVSDIVSSRVFKDIDITNNANIFTQPDNTITISGRSPLPTFKNIARIRFLENTLPANTSLPQAITSIKNSYGTNSEFLPQFLYINSFSQVITDPTTRTAVSTSVNDIITLYIADHENWEDFNLINNLSLLEKQLSESQNSLLLTYPDDASEINLFFKQLNKRISSL